MHWNEHVTDVDIMDVVYYPPSPSLTLLFSLCFWPLYTFTHKYDCLIALWVCGSERGRFKAYSFKEWPLDEMIS